MHRQVRRALARQHHLPLTGNDRAPFDDRPVRRVEAADDGPFDAYGMIIIFGGRWRKVWGALEDHRLVVYRPYSQFSYQVVK